VFIQKTDNQCCLKKKRDGSQHYLPAVLVPDGWLAEQNRAPRRETALADAPALHLPPVELRRSESNGRDLDVARLLAAKDANTTAAVWRLPSSTERKGAANNLVAKKDSSRKMGALATACSLAKAVLPSCTTPAHRPTSAPENG
jgi:hypothetical protein